MGGWGGLTVDILFMIAERIQVVEDFLSFSSVCVTWRAATLRKGSSCSLQPLRSLMFQSLYGDLNTNKNFKTIYSTARGNVCTVFLPSHKSEIYTNGWILTESYVADMSLIHPFLGHVISLPKKLASSDLVYDIKKAVLSFNPSFFPDDYTLMVIYSSSYRLGFWKPGDREWTVLQTRDYTFFQDIIYCRGQFYAIDQEGLIYACDVRRSNLTVRVVSKGRIPTAYKFFHLAEKTGKHSSLLIIDRGFRISDGNPRFFRVYELDLIGNGRVKELYDLGDRTIFVSIYHGSVCIEHSKFPPGIIVADYIYFHDFYCSEWRCRFGFPNTKQRHERGMYTHIYSLKGGDEQDLFCPLES